MWAKAVNAGTLIAELKRRRVFRLLVRRTGGSMRFLSMVGLFVALSGLRAVPVERASPESGDAVHAPGYRG